MDPKTPGRQSASDDFTAVKRIGPGPDDVTRESIAPAPERPIGEIAPGTRLGDYIVEIKVGQGGMGSVYRAVHPVIGKYAAIKVLGIELSDEYNIERFLDEAKMVNQIGHPNIVDVFSFGETPDGRSYLVMEWLKGETLRARMDRGPLPLVEICDVIRPLTRALGAAHEKGVIHRDLKPDNVFLVAVAGEPANVKLLDFGIARPSSTNHRVAKTATGAIVGTPLYIAPEQAKGRTIDSAADVYALGGMMFELLCGRPPFVADNAMEIVAKHLMEAPPRPSSVASVPPVLDDLVHAMLAKDPLERPLLATVNKVMDGLRERSDRPQTHPEDAATLIVAEPRIIMPYDSISEPAPATAVSVPMLASIVPSGPIEIPEPAPMTDAVTVQPEPIARSWKWLVPIAVIAAGAIAFVITSAINSNDLPTTSPAPALEQQQPVTPIERPRVEPPPVEPPPIPSPPTAPATAAPAAPTEAAPPKPAPPTVVRKPPPRRQPPVKPKPPTGKGSGTIPTGDALATPGSFTKKP